MGAELDDKILEIFAAYPEKELRWFELRDQLLNDTTVTSGNQGFSMIAFGVKLTRSLTRLVNQGLLVRSAKEHKNTKFRLHKKAKVRMLIEYGQSPYVRFLLIGTYKPGDTWKKFRAKAFERIGNFFETELRRVFKENKKRIPRKAQRARIRPFSMYRNLEKQKETML